MRLPSPALVLALASCAAPPDAAPWRPLFDGRTLAGWRVTAFGGGGDVAVRDGALHLDFGSPLTGITWDGEPPAREDFEVRVVAARVDGTDFFCGLTVPVGAAAVTLVVGGWGGALVGLSCIDGQDAASNETTSYHRFAAGQDVEVRLRVDAAAITAWLDGQRVAHVTRAGRRFDLRPEVLRSLPLGIAAFATRARLRSIEWRPLSPDRSPPP